jgi:hypothetical protein
MGPDGTGGLADEEWNEGLRFRISDLIDPHLPLLHLWRADFDLWFNERKWRWALDKETALAYFRDHKARWFDDGSTHAEGDPQLVPQVLKELVVLR